ncbi:MAG: acylphosphatase [Tepidisphaeraceae bacterium]
MSSAGPDTSASHRRTCHFSGRVQGVGFRYAVKNIASCHNVRGYVRNLPDGRVELVMEGPDAEMLHLLDEVHQKMAGYIQDVKSDTARATGEFEQFSIRH